MTEHVFTLVLAPDAGLENGEAVEALGAAGGTDATLSRIEPTVWIAEFTREADTFRAALTSAIRDVRRAGLGITRVEPDEYISLSEVAAYLDRSLESVRLLARGERGKHGGPFPQPAMRVTDRGHLWRRSAIARWDHRAAAELDRLDCIAAANIRLELALFDTSGEHAVLEEIGSALTASA
jgi:hypothetical protein